MIPADTWGTVPPCYDTEVSGDELRRLRDRLREETAEIAGKPKWWRRQHLSKAQRWGFEYRLAVLARIEEKLDDPAR